MDSLLQELMEELLKADCLNDSQKVELMSAIHTMYKYLDFLDFFE